MESAQRLHVEHQSIRSMLQELEGLIAAPHEADRDHFVAVVDRLVADLLQHFDHEERGGLFPDLAARRPSFARKVAELMRQHDDLRAQFKEVLAASKTASVADVAPALGAAIASLRDHERNETDFVQEAMLTDLGGGD